MNKDDVAKLYAETAGAEALERQQRAAAPRCRSCGVPVRWVTTPAGKKMPLDYDSHEDGNIVLYDTGRIEIHRETPHGFVSDQRASLHFSHFATCPNAAAHRRVGP